MSLGTLLLDLLPLLVFVVLDSMGNVRYALVGAVLAAALELAYSYFSLGGLDAFSVAMAAFILAFAALSYRFDNPVFFKFKPVAIGALTAAALLLSSAIGRPALLAMLDHYAAAMPAPMRQTLADEGARLFFTRLNYYLGFALALHAAATAWAALRLSRWWWFALSGPGLYLVVLGTGLLCRLF